MKKSWVIYKRLCFILWVLGFVPLLRMRPCYRSRFRPNSVRLLVPTTDCGSECIRGIQRTQPPPPPPDMGQPPWGERDPHSSGEGAEWPGAHLSWGDPQPQGAPWCWGWPARHWGGEGDIGSLSLIVIDSIRDCKTISVYKYGVFVLVTRYKNIFPSSFSVRFLISFVLCPQTVFL